jgi:hypothetical protein
MIIKPELGRKPTVERFRGPIVRGLSVGTGEVRPGSGIFGAGLIQGMAVVTRGEALGHGVWLDGAFVDQVQAGLDRLTRGPGKGAKARFTHPDMSSDGLGKTLGRVRYGKRDGDILRGNLHFYRVAHETPDGDLAKYVMGLADEDPAAFGASIVFVHDVLAEREFALAHGGTAQDDDFGGWVDYSGFMSPDPDNVQNLPHARLADLLAVDVVDDPAANPGGLFYRDPVFTDAEAMARFALGLSAEAPAMTALSIDPKRVQVFVAKFLERHDLTIVPKSESGAKEESPVSEQQQAAQDAGHDFRAELKRFREAFGAQGVQWFEDGKTFEQATELNACLRTATEAAEKQLTELREQNARLQASLDAAKQETDPVSGAAAGDAHDRQTGGKVSLKSLIRLPNSN